MGAKEDAERFFKRTDIWVNMVTMKAVAQRSGVTLPAVQQWKDRFQDFPKVMKPVRNDGDYGGWYWWPDVQEFKKRHGLGKR